MEKTMKFKEDYFIAIENLSDEKAGKFIKRLGEYFFLDKEKEIEEGDNIYLYFNLIKPSLDEEKEEINEEIIKNELALQRDSLDSLKSMFGNISTIQDLIDYEVCKLFYKEIKEDGKEEKDINAEYFDN